MASSLSEPEPEQNNSDGREGGGANFVFAPLQIRSTWTEGSPKHRRDENKPLIEVFRGMLMSSSLAGGQGRFPRVPYIRTKALSLGG